MTEITTLEEAKAYITKLEAELQQKQETYWMNAVAETSSDFIAVGSLAAGNATYINKAGAALLGLTVEQILSNPDLKIADVQPELPPEVMDIVMQEGQWRGETTLLQPTTGNFIPVSQVITLVKNDKGEPEYIATIARDITEQKLKEAQFQQIRNALKHTIDGVVISDLEGHITFVNDAFVELHRYGSIDEVIGKHLASFHTKEQLEQEVKPALGQVKQTGSFQGEIGRIKKDGTIFPGFVSISTLRNASGEPDGNIAIIRDIVEQKKAESEMRRMAVTIETSPDFIAIANMAGNCIYINPAGATMIGRRIEDIVNTDLSIADVQVESPQEAMQAVMEKGMWSGEITLIHKDGHHIPVSQVITLITNDIGEPEYLSTIARDIAKEKQEQAQRQQLQLNLIETQKQAMREIATPIIPVMDNILVMPLIGNIDSVRAQDIMRTVLGGITTHRARVVILDITGVPVIDTGVANHLNKTIQAARLKGTKTIITGISDAVAETIVDLGIDWGEMETLRDLQTGLFTALERLGYVLENKNSNGNGKQRF